MTWQSTLEEYPKHVHAIGMISIENSNLEFELANLLATTLSISRRLAHAIYFAPRASALRVDILEQAAAAQFFSVKQTARGIGKQKAEALKKVQKLTKRSRAIIQRRHEVIHESWGISEADREVSRRIISEWPQKESVLVPIQTLTDLIRDFRILIEEVMDLATSFKKKPPSMMDMRLNKKEKPVSLLPGTGTLPSSKK